MLYIVNYTQGLPLYSFLLNVLALHVLLEDLPYTFYLKICLMVLYELLCNVRIYIVFPTIEDDFAIHSTEDCIAVPSIVDCIAISST